MGKNVRRLAAFSGYCLYAVVVQVVLLWLLFPADALRQGLQTRLGAATAPLQWTIGELRLERPWQLTLTGIEIRPAGGGQLTVPRVVIAADLRTLLSTGTPRFSYQLTLPTGTLGGGLTYEGKAQRLRGEGEFSAIRLDQLQSLSQNFDRRVSGLLSGSFEYFASPWGAAPPTLRAHCVLAAGQLEFKQPVLGLTRFDFQQLSADLLTANKLIKISNGSIRSLLGTGSFDGTLRPGAELLATGLRIRGTFQPSAQLLGAADSDPTSRLVKERLRNGTLPFSISGTLAEPGILFRPEAGVEAVNLHGSLREP